MRKLIANLRSLLSRREKFHALILLGLMLAGAVLEMIGVGAIPAFVSLLTSTEALTESRLGGRVATLVGSQGEPTFILYASVGLLIVFAIKNGYLALLSWLQARYVFNRQIAIATRLFDAYLSSPYAFHLQRNSAELLRNTSSDAMEVVGSGLIPLFILTMEALTVSTILLLLLIVEPITSLAAFVIMGGTTVIFLRLMRGRVIHHGEHMHSSRMEMVKAVNEGLGGIKITKILGREESFVRAFAGAGDRYAHAGRIRQVAMETPRLLLEVVAIAGLITVAGLMVVQGKDTSSLVPTLALLAVAVVRMIPSFNRITGAMNSLRYGKFPVEKVANDLRELGAKVEMKEVSPFPFTSEIKLEHVSFTYPGASSASLKDVSLTIPRSSVIGLVGTTGSGKTTLVDVVMGLLKPDSGQVRVDGDSIAGKESEWQRQIGYVPQEVFMIDDSIRRNVAFGLPEDQIDDDAVLVAVETAQAAEFVNRLPDGLDTYIGERGVRLSGGQRQRIGIARALYHNPEVLVLDEATSALDEGTERAVMEAVEFLRGERTLLVIAHRKATVAGCDALIRMDNGQAAYEAD